MNNKFDEEIKKFLNMTSYLTDPAITFEEEFARERGWLSDQQYADLVARNNAKYPEFLAETRNIWTHIQSAYPEDVKKWSDMQFQYMEEQLQNARNGADGVIPKGAMITVYEPAIKNLKSLLNGNISDFDLSMVYIGLKRDF